MKVSIRKMDNSCGIIIPKPLLAQVELEDAAEMTVENNTLVLRRPRRAVRAGWTEASRALAQAGDDTLVWPEFANEEDKDL